MKKYLILLLLVGCTISGRVEDKNQWIICKDTRDGEIFYYNTDSVHDVRVGIGIYSAKLVTTKNDTIMINQNSNIYLKCAKCDSTDVK